MLLFLDVWSEAKTVSLLFYRDSSWNSVLYCSHFGRLIEMLAQPKGYFEHN